MDELELVESFRPAPATSVAEVLARALQAPDRDEIEQAAADRLAADARAEQRETQMMLNRQLGDPLGNVSRCQAAVAECRDEVADLENRLETARGRLSRATDSLTHWAGAADELHRASVRRSDTADLLGPAKAALAGHQQYVAASRAAREAVQAGTPRRAPRPFRGDVAVRSHLECIYCQRENVDPETSALLHLDPQHDVPITTAAQAEQAERRGHRNHAEISR